MEGLALFQILPCFIFMVDLGTFNKTWDCFDGPWPDVALVLKPFRRESADALLLSRYQYLPAHRGDRWEVSSC